jgi:hypothetical protein
MGQGSRHGVSLLASADLSSLLHCTMRSLLFLFLSATVTCAEPKLLPIDESGKGGFAKFKKNLETAVERCDANFIESILAADALASFGEDRGIEGFQRTYDLKDPKAPFWRELARVLSLGGTFNRARQEFTAPYVAARWPEKFDAMEYGALTGKDVVVRAAASAESKELARLSYSILKLAPDNDSAGQSEWIAVHLPAGGIGFVPASAMRSALDYRAQFRREGKKWKLASFLAGD